MGSLIYQAVASRDYPVLQGCLFVRALVIVTANLVTDLLCVALDPKVMFKDDEAE
jgi:peptide/nickel transport system permease protein